MSMTVQDMKKLLLEMEPDAIREKYEGVMDDEARAFLARIEAELDDMDDFLSDTGEAFRDAVGVPKPNHALGVVMPESKNQEPGEIMRASEAIRMLIRHPSLLAAAALLMASFSFLGYRIAIEREPEVIVVHVGEKNGTGEKKPIYKIPDITRGPETDDLEGLKESELTLYNALIDRGIRMKRHGERLRASDPERSKKLMTQALDDFMLAYKTRPEKSRALQYLADLFEVLGEEEKVKAYTEKYEEARRAELKELGIDPF